MSVANSTIKVRKIEEDEPIFEITYGDDDNSDEYYKTLNLNVEEGKFTLGDYYFANDGEYKKQ